MLMTHGRATPLRAGVVMAAILVLALVGAGSGAALRSGACKAGVHTVHGVSARTFCGPATARVNVGDATLVFSEGSCIETAKYVSVNIGTVILGRTTRRQPNYFGLDIGRIPGSSSPPAGKDGTYRSGTVLTVEYAGTSYDVLSGVASLKGHRSYGTIKGKAFSGQALIGTFHC